MRGFQPFQMERMLSRFEKEVEYNLSESGVHPVLLRELVDRENGYLQTLLDTDLNYPHTNGIPPLRQNIARLYQDGKPENVLVTVGAIEANYLVLKTLLAPGDEIVVMLPNYMQIWGLAKNHGLALKTFQLREETGWTPDLADLESVVTGSTRLIAVCNPNNPTGSVLSESEMDAIVNLADRVGSWILADEVYAGAERLTDEETPSFYGRYDKALVTGSLSKAYGLPGLRIGWVVAPAGIVDDIWARHEYTTISATMLSNQLAALALSPEVRPWLLRRTRSYIRRGYPVLRSWMDLHPGSFSLRPPDAGAIAFVRYHFEVNSTRLVERLALEKSVLIVPGDHFGIDHFVRVSFGLPHSYLQSALGRFHDMIEELSLRSIPGND